MSLPASRLAPALVAALFFAGTSLPAESKNPADYPLRIHIFNRTEHTFYHRHVEEESQGDGRANLFANGEVHAVDFSFNCNERVLASIGYETYPAKWKKPGKELIVLMPVMGKLNTFFTCAFDTNVKDDAYYSKGGHLETESPADFKAWMTKVGYDPEHGKDTPTRKPGSDGQ
jgi:hypothetical protein